MPGTAVTRRATASAVLLAAAAGAVAVTRRWSADPLRSTGSAPADTTRTAGTRTAGTRTAGTRTAGGSTAGGSEAVAGPIAIDRPQRPPVPVALPRGGREVFPAHRLVGYSGGPGSAAFGRLGVGDLDGRADEIERLAVRYAAGRTPLPVLELIAVVVQPRPGRDGTYRVRIGPDVVDAYLAAARRHRALLLLNVQPGRARFLDEVRALERWLVEPDVGIALDPEWAVGAGQVPGRVFGRTTGADLDGVAAYLAGLVTGHGLPQKVMVVHQLRVDIVDRFGDLGERPEVAVVQSVDGIGPPAAKIGTWGRVSAGRPSGVRPGFKLFFDEDTEAGSRLMTPAEVLALRPVPEYVLYE